MDNASLIILIIPLILMLLGVVGYFVHLYLLVAERRAKIDQMNWHRYDGLGNPEFYYNPRTGQHYLPEVGNKAFAELPNIQVEQKPIKRFAPPLVINTQEKKLSEPQRYFSASEPEEPIEPDSSEPDILALLLEAKLKGESKNKAIPRVTGYTKGDSPNYKFYSEFWNNN